MPEGPLVSTSGAQAPASADKPTPGGTAPQVEPLAAWAAHQTRRNRTFASACCASSSTHRYAQVQQLTTLVLLQSVKPHLCQRLLRKLQHAQVHVGWGVEGAAQHQHRGVVVLQRVPCRHRAWSGMHFGQTSREWNPRMPPYVNKGRNGRHVSTHTSSLYQTTHSFLTSQLQVATKLGRPWNQQ